MVESKGELNFRSITFENYFDVLEVYSENASAPKRFRNKDSKSNILVVYGNKIGMNCLRLMRAIKKEDLIAVTKLITSGTRCHKMHRFGKGLWSKNRFSH